MPQLAYTLKMDCAVWYVGWAARVLITPGCVIATVNLSVRKFQTKNEH